MASYRPKIKLNASGETRDLPLDAETLKGKTLDYFASKSEMNSGLANKQNNLNQTQLDAINSGITNSKVATYDGYANQIKEKATASNVYSKSEVDSKDANTLNNAKSYTDTQLKTITDNIVKEVICSHQYEITGNTGDEHGLAIEDQQMLIKKIEGQTKVVNGDLVNSNCVLKSSGRNLIKNCLIAQNIPAQNTFIEKLYFVKGVYTILIDCGDNSPIDIHLNNLLVSTISGTPKFLKIDNDTIFDVSLWIKNQKSNIKVMLAYGYIPDLTYEPFKEDTIDGIGSLGQYDYIDMIGQKKVLANGDIVTLNGNENWLLYKGDMYSNIVDKDSAQGVENLPNNSSFKIDLGTDSARLRIELNGQFTVETWKQYLAQNPIQLVYKKATPTQVPINLPNGMAVYNGGLQSQIGDVPYKITKQYSLSQKAQTLANIEIDREQQAQIDELKALNLGWEVVADNMEKYFSGDGTGSVLSTDIQNKMSDMNAIYALTFDASGGGSTDDFITKTQYGTIYLSNQIDNYYGKKVLLGNGSIISRTFGLYVITAIYSNGSLNVLTQDAQKRSSAVHLQTIKKLVLKK